MRSWGQGASKRRWVAFWVCLPLLLGSCSTGPKIPVHDELWGTQLVTTVDAEVVKYYVESYLAGKNTNPALHAKISALHARYPNDIPGREELADISKSFSVDFAGERAVQ